VVAYSTSWVARHQTVAAITVAAVAYWSQWLFSGQRPAAASRLYSEVVTRRAVVLRWR